MAKEPKLKVDGRVDMDLARRRGREAAAFYMNAKREAESDIAFLAGQHWTAAELAERRGRISLTLNDLGQYLDKVVGDNLMNPTAVHVIPADFGANNSVFTSTSGNEYEASEVWAGLIRQIEYRCGAVSHYNLALQHAAESGLGFLRLYSDYMGTRSFEQEMRIERIKNRFSVSVDPEATQPDFSDQNYCLVDDWMRKDEFDKKHPKMKGKSAGGPIIDPSDNMTAWFKEGFVRLSEYYYREEVEVEIAELRNGRIITDGADAYDEDQQKEAKRIWSLAEKGGHIVRKRTARTWVVKWAKLSYHDVIEGPYRMPGTMIPVAPVIGKRIEGDQDTLTYGLIRFAKEPKRMENLWASAATERVGVASKAPWLVTPEMIKGHESQWRNANRGLPAYLLYNPDATTPGAKPDKDTGATMPVAEIQMLRETREIVKGSIGLHDAAVGKDTNKQSGRALLALEQQANIGNFVFTANLRLAVSYIGRCLVEWIPVIYGNGRRITVRMENGDTDTIDINRVDEEGNLLNDMRDGEFDVNVTTGPAYMTLRQQAAESMLSFYQAAPDYIGPTADIFLEMQDWPGAKRMAKRIRKMVPPGVLDESELSDEEKEAPPPEPTPEEQLAMKELETRDMEADADMATAEAKKVKAEADMAIAGNKVTVAQEQNVLRSIDAAQAAQAAPVQQAPAQPGAEDQAVTRDEFETLRTDVAQALAQIQQTLNGVVNNG